MPNANTAASLLKSMFKNERIDVLVPSDIVTVSIFPVNCVLFNAHHKEKLARNIILLVNCIQFTHCNYH